MCSIYIHPSLIFVCARNANGIVCVAHNNKNTRRRIHLSLTHTHTRSVWNILRIVYCTMYMVMHTDTSTSERERVISKQEHFWGRAFFSSYIRSILYLMYGIYVIFGSSSSSRNNGNFAEIFSSASSYWCVCVRMYFFWCLFSFVATLFLTRAILFCKSLSWFTCFGGQVLPSDLLSMYNGIVNDNNFSHFIFNDRSATYLWVHINNKKIGRISFIYSILVGRR